MIKNKTLRCSLPLLLLSTFSYAHANECTLKDSATPSESKNYIRCLDGQISALHRTQTMWINKLTLDLNKLEQETGNTQLLPIFKRSLTSQNQFVEANCRWRYLHEMPNAKCQMPPKRLLLINNVK